MYSPTGVAVDPSGNLYIADPNNDVVYKVTPSGQLSIFAGKIGDPGAPTPGLATDSELYNPQGVAVDQQGDVYIADTSNLVIEKITPSGMLSVVAGVVGRYGTTTPGPATSAYLGDPVAVAVNSAGDIFIGDVYRNNNVVDEVNTSGTLSIFAGVQGQVGYPTPGPATSSDLGEPTGVAVDSAGDVYIADWGDEVIEKVTPGGTLSVVAGDFGFGYPTPGPAVDSELWGPYGVATDSAGDFFVADEYNHVVEEVAPSGTLVHCSGQWLGWPPDRRGSH